MSSLGADLTEIAVLFIGVATLALVIGHASNTATVVQSVTSGFNSLLNTVENPGSSTGLSSLTSV